MFTSIILQFGSQELGFEMEMEVVEPYVRQQEKDCTYVPIYSRVDFDTFFTS